MSRYIFASLGVRNELIREKLREKLDTSKRVLIIPCAASNEELTAKVEKEAFCKSGFEQSKIYAFDTAKPNKYSGIFFDYIYIPGGDQYKLLSEIKEHEIDKKIIIPCLEKGATYIGISAGAYVAAQDMRYCLLLEPNDRYPLDDYIALGLVDCNVICHYDKYGSDIYNHVKEASGGKDIITIDDDMVVEFKR